MLDIKDWIIWALYFVSIMIVLLFFQSSKSSEVKRYYLFGFLIKVTGGLAFMMIYLFHYKGVGDTFLYFGGAKQLSQVILESPVDYFRLLFSNAGQLPPDLSQYTNGIFYAGTSEEWFTVKLLSPFVLLSFQSYLVTTLFISTLSFYGAWKLFLVFHDILRGKAIFSFLAAFLIPSTIFWGSGIVKDTISLVCINMIIYALYFGLSKRGKLKLVIVSLVWAYLVFRVKAYVLLSFLPSFFIIWNYFLLSKSKNKSVKFFLTPLLFLLIGAVSYFSFQNLTLQTEKYNQENLMKKLVGFHTWHTTIGESSYSLGEIEYTPTGIAKKIPSALFTTFFKPFLWEAKNPVILMSAIESFFLFIIFLFVSLKTRFQYRKYLHPKFLRSLIVFVLLFGFIVGFTSYNYGALSRYKIPVMPIFVFILIFMIKSKSREKSKFKNELETV
ncbi:MAG: hypothetical protein AB8B74_05345 [Crocinitomicaceae bacterium]